jgi:hypothetical protein
MKVRDQSAAASGAGGKKQRGSLTRMNSCTVSTPSPLASTTSNTSFRASGCTSEPGIAAVIEPFTFQTPWWVRARPKCAYFFAASNGPLFLLERDFSYFLIFFFIGERGTGPKRKALFPSSHKGVEQIREKPKMNGVRIEGI